MDLRGYRMVVDFRHHPEYMGLGDYFGTGKPRNRSPEEWVRVAEGLAIEHGGVLPCAKLISKNYCGLYNAMLIRPELFAHIPQDKPYGHRRTSVQWVVFAEELAAEHGGVLPNAKLIQKRHSGLWQAMWRCPELFAHIKQDKPHRHHKSPEQWVRFAESLAAEHGGVLPSASWLRKRHCGIVYAIQKHPELFAHIRQELLDNHGRIIGYREPVVQGGA